MFQCTSSIKFICTLQLQIKEDGMLSAQIHSDFLNLPLELIFKIIDELPLQAQLSLADTCQDMNNITRDEYFWRKRIRAISPSELVLEPTKENFKTRLKRIYSEIKFLEQHFAKILALSDGNKAAQQQLNKNFECVKSLMKYPWGENSVADLSEADQLLIAINEITIQLQLPPPIAKSLRLEHITRLPARSISQNQAIFSQLERLELNGNLLETLPENINICLNLLMLDLYDTAITFFPKHLKDLTQLQFFYCSGGNTSQLPDMLYTNPQLKWVAYDNMHLVSIGEDIKNLKVLSWLYLANNQISVLPCSFSTLTALRELFLSNNPLSALQSQKVTEFLQSIQCDVKDKVKRQATLLKRLRQDKSDDVSHLAEQFDLLSITPQFTPNQARLKRLPLSCSLDSTMQVKRRTNNHALLPRI